MCKFIGFSKMKEKQVIFANNHLIGEFSPKFLNNKKILQPFTFNKVITWAT